MCGIAGWMRYGDAKVTENEIKRLLVNLSVRGTNATGVAWRRPDLKKVVIFKTPEIAKDYIKQPVFEKELENILNSPCVLLHTRQATHGSPQENKNNHPIMNDLGLIIHNGIVFSKESLTGETQTDSEQILLHIQKYGWEGLKNLSGSMACAYMDFSQPGFYLFTDGQSLTWGYDTHRKIAFFCSTADIFYKSIDVHKAKGIFPVVSMTEVPENKVYHINGTIKVVAEIPKVKYTYTGGIPYVYQSNYYQRTLAETYPD